MRFEWKNDPHIGHYELILWDKEKRLNSISFVDYTCDFNQKRDREERWARPYSFEVRYCHGWSCEEGFDYDEEYDRHFNENDKFIGGYQGKCTHTVEDIKRWCEEFLASQYIIDYEQEFAKLQERKRKSEWFIDCGYTGKTS